MITTNEIQVCEVEDLKSGMQFTIAFEGLNDFTEFIRFYNRPLDIKWLEAAWSFGYDPIYKEGSENK